MDPNSLPEEEPDLRALLAEKEAMLAATQEAAARLQLLYELSQKIGLAESEAEFYGATAFYAVRMFPQVNRSSIALINKDKSGLELFALEGLAGPMPVGTKLPFDNTMVGMTAHERRTVLIAGTEFEETRLLDLQKLRAAGMRSALTAPLIAGGRVIGTLNTASPIPEPYGDHDPPLLLQVATLLAAHVERWRLLGELQVSLDESRRHEEDLRGELAERARGEHERAALKDEIIQTQRRWLKEMSTPLIPITEHVMVMPLIGPMDADRAAQVLDTALQGARDRGAEIVIIDITGMQQIDSHAAQALISTALALRLVGAQTALTGVRPHIAQTLLGLGVDLGRIMTFATLQSAIMHALSRARGHA